MGIVSRQQYPGSDYPMPAVSKRSRRTAALTKPAKLGVKSSSKSFASGVRSNAIVADGPQKTDVKSAQRKAPHHGSEKKAMADDASLAGKVVLPYKPKSFTVKKLMKALADV
jgi:hypothetical protein